jgi:hypothetical protein
MKRLNLTLLLLLALLPTLVFAQLKRDATVDVAKALTQPASKIQGIVGLLGLDPTRFSMSQSYSLSFTTGGGHSYNQGLYLNTMRYQLADPLSMYLQLGFVHQPLGNLGQNSLQQQSEFFVSGAGLEYKPSDNLKFQFEFSQRPSSYSPYYPYNYYNRFERNSLFEKEEDKE